MNTDHIASPNRLDFVTYLSHYTQKAAAGQVGQRAKFVPNGVEALAALVAAADKLNADGHRVWVVSYGGDLWADCLTPGGGNAGWYSRHHRIHARP